MKSLTCDSAVDRSQGSLVYIETLAEDSGDASLQAIGGRVVVAADLRHETGSEVSQCPVIIHVRLETQLSTHYARQHGGRQFVQLSHNCITS